MRIGCAMDVATGRMEREYIRNGLVHADARRERQLMETRAVWTTWLLELRTSEPVA